MSRKQEEKTRSRKLERATKELTTRLMTPQNMIIGDGKRMGDQVSQRKTVVLQKNKCTIFNVD